MLIVPSADLRCLVSRLLPCLHVTLETRPPPGTLEAAEMTPLLRHYDAVIAGLDLTVAGAEEALDELRGRVEDLTKENATLYQTVRGLCSLSNPGAGARFETASGALE